MNLIDETTFNTYDYLDHLFECIRNPYTMHTKLRLNCLGDFGGPIQPYVVLGDFGPNNKKNAYELAQGLVIFKRIALKLLNFTSFLIF